MVLLAGPCVIESEESVFKIAQELLPYHEDPSVDFYFKASFDKANRTSLESFRGPGMQEGLLILQKLKERFGYKVVTDVHETYQVAPVSEVVDMLQIPAFLCRQTDLLVAAAKSSCKINIKKGQFLSAEAMRYPALKVLQTRGIQEATYENAKKHGLYLCERGNSFGYGNLVVDMRNLPIMRRFAPVLFDATHSVQMPAGQNGTTGGDSSMVPYLARAAAAVGVDGFFFETHFDPTIALSDGANMIRLEQLRTLLEQIKAIEAIVKNKL